MEQVSLAGIGRRQIAEHSLGIIDDAVGNLVAGAGIEVVGKHILVGNGVHAPGGEAAGEVLQILGVSVKHGSSAAHSVSAVVLAHNPVGILGGLLGVEGVVAGAGGAQIAEGLVVELVVLAVLLHGEDDCAVVAVGLAVLNHGSGRGDGAGVHVRDVSLHAGEHALGSLVEDDNLVVLLGQTGPLLAVQLVDTHRLLGACAVA